MLETMTTIRHILDLQTQSLAALTAVVDDLIRVENEKPVVTPESDPWNGLPAVITLSKAAKVSGKSVNTLKKWARTDQRFPGSKRGRIWMIDTYVYRQYLINTGRYDVSLDS